MRYLLRQKLFAWGDDFLIQNDDGDDVYFVDGKALSFGDQLSFQDLERRELLYIKQRVLSWQKVYEIHRDGELAAVVTKELFTLFACRFSVDVPGPDDLTAEGDFLDHEYEFKRGDRVVATVSKRWFSWTDTYGVETSPGEDDVLLLAASVVIDMACHDNSKRRRG